MCIKVIYYNQLRNGQGEDFYALPNFFFKYVNVIYTVHYRVKLKISSYFFKFRTNLTFMEHLHKCKLKYGTRDYT